MRYDFNKFSILPLKRKCFCANEPNYINVEIENSDENSAFHIFLIVQRRDVNSFPWLFTNPAEL